MTCPRCQQQSPPDADFCPHCGAKLAAVCVDCGTEPGKWADIIAVRTRSPSLLPWHDPEANLVYAARGPDVVAAHATYLSDAEADLVGSRRTAVAHCPSSNAKLEGRVAPIARMRRAGAIVGLGTDAACCNNGMDLFEEMKVAGLLNKVAADDPAALPSLDLLRAATSEAARALGIDHLVGTLEPGKRADIIAVRTRSARLQPWHDPVANLVYAARGSDVVAVFVNGEQLVRGGRRLKLDAERILADATQPAGRLTNVGA